MSATLAPAQVVPAGQMMPAQMPSSLAAAMMGRMGAGTPNLQNPMAQVPLGSIMQMQMLHNMQNPNAANQPGLMSNLTNGVGNLFSGYNWNGTPGASQMGALSSQAAGNVAGGAAGL